MRRRAKIGIAVPVVIAALAGAYYVALTASQRRYDAAVARLHEPARMQLYRALRADKPTPAVDAAALTRARENLSRWQTIFAETIALQDRTEWQATRGVPFGKPESLSDAEKRLLHDLVTTNSALLDGIRAAAAHGGPAMIWDYTQQQELPLQEFSACDWLLRVDAFIAVGQDDLQRAAQDLIASLQLANLLLDEPLQLSHWFATNMYAEVYRTLAESLPPNALPREQEQTVIEELSKGADRERFAQGIAGEAASMVFFFEHPRAPGSLNMYGDGSVTSYVQGTFWTFYPSPVARPWRNIDLSEYADFAVELHRAAALPHWEAAPLVKVIARRARRMPRTYLVAREYGQFAASAFRERAEHEARIHLARVGLTIERYHADHGAYPDSLDAIADLLPGGLPLDPFTGKPLFFRVTDDTFTLYSAGNNLTDDGGRHSMYDGDIVWRGVNDDELEIESLVIESDGATVEFSY